MATPQRPPAAVNQPVFVRRRLRRQQQRRRMITSAVVATLAAAIVVIILVSGHDKSPADLSVRAIGPSEQTSPDNTSTTTTTTTTRLSGTVAPSTPRAWSASPKPTRPTTTTRAAVSGEPGVDKKRAGCGHDHSGATPCPGGRRCSTKYAIVTNHSGAADPYDRSRPDAGRRWDRPSVTAADPAGRFSRDGERHPLHLHRNAQGRSGRGRRTLR